MSLQEVIDRDFKHISPGVPRRDNPRDACVGTTRQGELVYFSLPVLFRNCNLSKLDLSLLDLSESTFEACNLAKSTLFKASKCLFIACDLTDTSFAGGDIRWSEFRHCKSDGVDLTGVQMTFDCYLLPGLNTSRKSDAYKLLFWATALNNPVMQEGSEVERVCEHCQTPSKIMISARDLIPREANLLLEKAFERNPR